MVNKSLKIRLTGAFGNIGEEVLNQLTEPAKAVKQNGQKLIRRFFKDYKVE